MTSTEQRAFETTRVRIERNLSRISTLAGDAQLPAVEFFRQFVELTVDSLEAAGGAIWNGQGQDWTRLTAVRFFSSGAGLPAQDEWMRRALTQCLTSQKTCIVAAGPQEPDATAEGLPSAGNAISSPFFYVPILLDGRVRLILQIWLQQAGDPRSYGDIATFLGQLSAQATAYLRLLEKQNLGQSLRRAEHMLRLQEELLGELSPRLLAAHTANYLVDLMPCDLACVLQRQGRRWLLLAVSNQEALDPRSVQSRALASLAGTLAQSPEGGAAVRGETTNLAGSLAGAPEESAPPDPVADERNRWLEETGLLQVQWCHLRSSRRSGLDFLLLTAWHSRRESPESARETLTWTARQLGKALEAATHYHHLPLRPLTALVGRINRAWHLNRRRRVFTHVLLPMGLILGGLALPWPWKISADCTVVPRRVVAVVAETSGKIVEVAAHEGQQVGKNALLGRLDDTEYTMQLAVARQQRLRWEVEAARAQALGNEAERKIAEIQRQREEDNIQHLLFLQSRTRLVAPMEGVVLTRNLQDREGESLEAGSVFCEIGSVGSYDVQLDIRQKDLGTVLSALGDGRTLPAEFILHAHPKDRLQVQLTDPGEISQLPEPRKDQTVFLARLPFPGDQDGALELKAGYTGRAKILMGRRPAGWLLVQPFLNYWRTTWGV